MAKVRWGLIGATVIGREWMMGAIREAGGDIVAVMSTDSARGRAYANEFGIPKAVGSLPELFASGVEAVYVSTTNERHRAETIAAAEARVHVLCEKPLATSLADASAMVGACRSAGIVLATNHHLRNGAIAQAMRQAIRAGRIGRPLIARVVHAGYLPEHLHGWRLRDLKAGAGAILDLTVHDADLLRFILDDEPESVATCAQNGGLAATGIEDAALILVRFRSGLIAQLFDGFTTRTPKPESRSMAQKARFSHATACRKHRAERSLSEAPPARRQFGSGTKTTMFPASLRFKQPCAEPRVPPQAAKTA
jgi:1,5-anhydro-D-fructose reductase (1,5-anhydro-D-mannitol-forming)